MVTMVINLKQFDLNKIVEPLNRPASSPTIIVIGEHAANLIHNILFNTQSKMKFGTIMTTKKDSDLYCDIFSQQQQPDISLRFITEYNNKKVINSTITSHLNNLQNYNHTCLCNGFMILDLNNVLYSNINRNKHFLHIFMNGRCKRNTLIVSKNTLYPIQLDPVLISNTDYIFIFNHNDIVERQKLYYCAPQISTFTFEIFCQILDTLGENQCLVVDNTVHTGNIEDIVSRYNCIEPPLQ